MGTLFSRADLASGITGIPASLPGATAYDSNRDIESRPAPALPDPPPEMAYTKPGVPANSGVIPERGIWGSFADSIHGNIHTALDVVGMLPIAGEIADGINGLIYLAEGDKLSAGLSAASMIPIAGNAVTGGKWAAKGIKAAEAATDAADTLKKAKKVPNPHGSKGGPAHQKKIAEVRENIENRGLTPFQEISVPTPGGHKDKRIPDLQAKDADGNLVEIHQIGKQRKDGLPVKRELDAMQDLQNATGVPPTFHPYNKIEK